MNRDLSVSYYGADMNTTVSNPTYVVTTADGGNDWYVSPDRVQEVVQVMTGLRQLGVEPNTDGTYHAIVHPNALERKRSGHIGTPPWLIEDED